MDSIFKQTLRSEMDFQDMRVKELAARTGISKRTLEGYLGARGSIPPADVAVKIASALNVSVEYLVTGKRNIQSSENVKSNIELSIDSLPIEKKNFIKDFISMIGKYDFSKTGE